MNTKDLRNLFNIFTAIIETNPADVAERNMFGLDKDVNIPCPEDCVGVCTMPAELRDGSLGLAVEYTYLDMEGDAYTTLLVLRPDYATGRMVREMPIRARATR